MGGSLNENNGEKKCKEGVNNSKVQTRETRKDITPDCALELLTEGNKRFTGKKPELNPPRDLKQQVKVTSKGQFPFAAVLSCIDSRIPTETIFDQGIGDIFNARIAGNFVNRDILGSLEFTATHDDGQGVKLIFVLGHTGCGAINAAVGAFEDVSKCDCSKEEESNIMYMVNNLCPPVLSTSKLPKETYKSRVTEKNVVMTMDKIRRDSETLREAEGNGSIKICGGIYDIATGEVKLIQN